MSTLEVDPRTNAKMNPQLDFDALIIGAGACGLYQIHKLTELGFRVTALEANADVGGTWYRNRYPGCRFDSESYTYNYSFSEELLQEWNWSEHFSSQPETLRYFEYVADKFDLRKHIQFNTRVKKAVWNEDENFWTVFTDTGKEFTTRFLLTAIGLLSSPTMPRYEGVESFEGTSTHTFDWPAEGIPLEGKRVAVVGTGSSGIQVIADIASKVKDLVVFQRRPNWCAPLKNSAISEQEMDEIKRSYSEIFEKCKSSPSGFIHRPRREKMEEDSPEERLAFWESLYNSPGFGVWLGNYKDILTDPEANAEFSAFIADKIRSRVHDPEVAEKLIPKDHGFGTRRVPLETDYYEAYNRENVQLVDISETPIERVTPKGIKTSDQEFEFDVIVYATGFDAITGSFDKIEFQGVGGKTLKDKWNEDLATTFGVQSHGFPNLFFLLGPQSGSVATNFPIGIGDVVDWTTQLLEHLRANGCTRIEPHASAEADWVEHVRLMSTKTLMGSAKSWFNGYNSNIKGGDSPRLLIYAGGGVRYRKILVEQAEGGYPAFALERTAAEVHSSH